MSVKTVRVVDPRIEPQGEPTYSTTISPKQNQFYKIPASGLSNSYITFNNLTTLGADRAYLDTFELEISATITFNVTNSGTGTETFDSRRWTFDSFPFNKCCEEARVNINGGSFFSQPMSYIRAKERYWNERKLDESYGNVCPCHKPWGIREDFGVADQILAASLAQLPTRFSNANETLPKTIPANYSTNNDIVDNVTRQQVPVGDRACVVTVHWREPIFCSPFSSRYDETYGRPLYNITSMDLSFNMQNLGNMIRVRGVDSEVGTEHIGINNYSVNLDSINLCYQVLTIPPSLSVPPATIVPYRRIVPYITDSPLNPVANETNLRVTSGVYTLNEVPTAIWIFLGPTKAELQDNAPDFDTANVVNRSWSYNKLAQQLTHLSISCANTTQILNTAEPLDLYRIAKANGCQDNFTSWGRSTLQYVGDRYRVAGVGSFLRLIPGTDIVLPDQPLIPGANANNMVFQVEADFYISNSNPSNYRNYALWLLFEYVGVATITPGQCEISMNPLGSGTPMTRAPVVSAPATPAETANTEGSGWLDTIGNVISSVSNSPLGGVVRNAIKLIPGVGGVLSGLLSNNVNSSIRGQNSAPPRRRPRITYDDEDERYEGGSVRGFGTMGLNDFI